MVASELRRVRCPFELCMTPQRVETTGDHCGGNGQHTQTGHLRVPLTSSISRRILRPCAPSNDARTHRRSMRRLDAYLRRYILHSFKAKNVAITTQKLMIAEAMKPLILISELS
jgi:hypothetical protein